MKITDIRAFSPPTPGAPPDWRTHLGQIVVQVQTDSQLDNRPLTGMGVGGGGAAGIHVIHTVLRNLLIGQEVEPVEDLHRRMLAETVFYGRKGIAVMAVSGVDLALWDLRGKAAQAPVARLLNPQADLQQPLPTYTTVFDEAQARQAIQDGCQAVKLHVERFGDRPSAEKIAQYVQQVRAEIGPAAPLMIDAFARWNVETTLQVAQAVEPYGLIWLEEPLPPDDEEGYRILCRQSPIPIAGGEHEYLADGFERLIQQRLHTVLQPDINWCGGMTTMVEIYRLGRQAKLRVCPHRGSEPFALHAIAALDPQPLAESPRRWFTCLDGAPQIERGLVRVHPNAFGFGVRLN